jgi:hypothetical protein
MVNEDVSFLKQAGRPVKSAKPVLTPLYIAWWFQRDKIVEVLAPRSDLKLVIKLAKDNKDDQGAAFFKGLQEKQPIMKNILKISSD